MSEQWYCSIRGKETGPLSAEQLKAIASKGRLSPDDLVRCGTSGGWVPARRVKGLFSDHGQVTHEGDASPKPPVSRPPASAGAAPPPPPPHQVTPPPLASSAALGPPPIAADLPFLNEPAAPPQRVADAASVPEPTKTQKDKRQQRQLLLVGTLLAVFVVLTVAVIFVYFAVNEAPSPAPSGAEVAVRAPAEKPKGAVPLAAVGAGAKTPAAASGKASPPTPERAAKPPAAKVEEAKWVSAKDSVATLGEIQVKVRSAVLAHPKGWNIPSQVDKSAQFLVLTLELSNSSKNRKIDHAGWGTRSAARVGVKLTDEIPNSYALKGAALGQTGSEAIYPGQSIEDKLIFERPIDVAKVLRLQLPASAFGGKGIVQFEIPRDMIVQSTEPPEPPEPPEAPSPAKAEAKRQAGATAETKPAKPRGEKADDELQRTGDPKADFGIGEGDNQMGRPPAGKRPVPKAGVEKADRDRQTQKSDKSGQAGLKEKPADKEGDRRGAGFNRTNQDQSPF